MSEVVGLRDVEPAGKRWAVAYVYLVGHKRMVGSDQAGFKETWMYLTPAGVWSNTMQDAAAYTSTRSAVLAYRERAGKDYDENKARGDYPTPQGWWPVSGGLLLPVRLCRDGVVLPATDLHYGCQWCERTRLNYREFGERDWAGPKDVELTAPSVRDTVASMAAQHQRRTTYKRDGRLYYCRETGTPVTVQFFFHHPDGGEYTIRVTGTVHGPAEEEPGPEYWVDVPGCPQYIRAVDDPSEPGPPECRMGWLSTRHDQEMTAWLESLGLDGSEPTAEDASEWTY